MSPSVAPFNGPSIDRSADGRPVKRPRKDSLTAEGIPHQEQFTAGSSSSQDHVFISESLTSKKQGGKKVGWVDSAAAWDGFIKFLTRLIKHSSYHLPDFVRSGSCKKRGVSDICPDGVLVSGKGTRFILANTEQLHAKIQEMSEHIRRLEEALEGSSSPSNPHPLLQPEMLNVKSTMQLYGVAQPKHGGTSIPMSSERTVDHDIISNVGESNWNDTMSSVAAGKRRDDRMEAEILRLNHAFPLGDGRTSIETSLSLREYIRCQLPSRQESAYIWEQMQANASWHIHPDPSFIFNLLHHCYSTSLEELSPRRLALLFMILAIGCLVDLNRPAESPDSEKYHMLARAALCEIPVLEDTTVETVTALYYELWFLLLFSDKKKSDQAWALMGLTAKLAQSIGLHRNGVKSKVIPEEVENRRSLFWELLCLDSRLALSLGRPPSFSVKHMDCPRPMYLNRDNHESSYHYQNWKHSFYVECLYPVVDALSQPGIQYSTVLELDMQVRNFPIPDSLQKQNSSSRNMLLQQVHFTMAYESVLLQLHRTYFMRALSGPEEAFNKRHRYAPSVVAVWLGAVRMIAAVENMYRREPELTARILGYWSNTFSAVVAIALLVSRAPFTCLSSAGLQELQRARLLYKAVTNTCPRSNEIVPMLDIIIAKANNIFQRWYHGQDVPTLVLRHEDEHDTFIDELIRMDSNQFVPAPSPPPTDDSFKNAHPLLTQCIAEAHERAKIMFPMRKPCQCSVGNPATCPPSHSWAPPPPIDLSRPLLPYLYAEIANPFGFDAAPVIPPIISHYTGSNSVNFELGALHPNTAQSWMGWF
ncbi:fungal-specific transcription factor domain-containing protein [Lentinula aciculospora]|uniref:Fungal-specific transcription factor domain-containing protein n=1 Tax=Lentinula aciculospora TaxID=153920 RepID=A0A9W9DRB6_9AGAR|nr:fungal-specific transcription factor domain-containing protein [Lentinula aciculospora]